MRAAVEHSAERVRGAAAGDVKSLQICEKDVTKRRGCGIVKG